MGNGGYDVLHYDLALNVDMDVEEISAAANITAASRQRLRRFNLDFQGFDILSVKVNGEDADFSHELGELSISPAAEIPSGVEFTVEVVYAGRPGGGEAYMGIDFLEGVFIRAGPLEGEEMLEKQRNPEAPAAEKQVACSPIQIGPDVGLFGEVYR